MTSGFIAKRTLTQAQSAELGFLRKVHGVTLWYFSIKFLLKHATSKFRVGKMKFHHFWFPENNFHATPGKSTIGIR